MTQPVASTEKLTFERVTVEDPQADQETQKEATGITGALMPEGGEMSSLEFAEFYSIGLWDASAAMGSMMGLDLNLLKTPKEKHSEAITAGEALYTISGRYPKAMGWMRSPAAAMTGELAIVAGFFGGKIMSIPAALAANNTPTVIEGDQASA